MLNRTSTTALPDRTAALAGPGIVLLAALVAAPVSALPEDADQPVSIEADKGTADLNPNGVTKLSGSVVVEQGTLRIAAHHLTLTNRGGKLARAVATGAPDEPARLRQQVRADEPFVIAHAETIDYRLADNRIELRGEAFLSNGDGEFTGGIIVYDVKENHVDCKAGCRVVLPPTTDSD